jgi:hypothetical protein
MYGYAVYLDKQCKHGKHFDSKHWNLHVDTETYM